MLNADIIRELENFAPPVYQESYDNSGLLTGNAADPCTGVLLSLDITEETILEAVEKKLSLVVAHHPVIFRGIKKLSGNSYVNRAVIAAIKNDIALYALHTNADNVLHGVSTSIAERLGLKELSSLQPLASPYCKLYTFVPDNHLEKVKDAVFAAGAGSIGRYRECSFTVGGTGTFLPGSGTKPFTGTPGERNAEKEQKIEFIFPAYLEGKIIQALKAAHPYEEVAYDLVQLKNTDPAIGSGLIGQLDTPFSETGFLALVKSAFHLLVIRHTPFTGRPVKKVAVCGGAGSFLISKALELGADCFITSDIKYHEFFDADGKMILADIGHFESEQFAPGLFGDVLQKKFPNFAVLKSELITNPVQYYL